MRTSTTSLRLLGVTREEPLHLLRVDRVRSSDPDRVLVDDGLVNEVERRKGLLGFGAEVGDEVLGLQDRENDEYETVREITTEGGPSGSTRTRPPSSRIRS